MTLFVGLTPLQWALLGAAFLAAVLSLEGAALLWQHTRSPAVRRLQRRLQTWIPQWDATPATPRAGSGRVQQALDQAGWAWTPGTLMGLSATLACLAILLGLLMGPTIGPLPTVALASGLAALPWLALQHQRRKRLQRAVFQLPDALDLMARALRSGHAFSTAVQFAAEEGPAPLALEFRRVADQIAWGQDPDTAFEALARRLPQDDVRFFVMAVRLQRQTGGSLAELMGNLGQLLRQRQRLLDKVRVLSAEGRLSAKVLAALPCFTAMAIYAIRPEFIAVLWTDPAGLNLLKVSGALMATGGVWLWRLTQIRV